MAKRINNPTGNGGFKDHPETINKKGASAPSWSWKGLLERFLEEEDITGVPAKVAITRKLIDKARKGDHKAIDTVMDRTEGKPKQTVELNSPEEDFKKYYDQLKRVQDADKDVPSK